MLLVAGTLAVCGCGRDGRPDPPPSGLDPLQPSTPAATGNAAPGVALGSTQALTSMPWKLAAISEDRRTITVRYVGGDGYCLKHAGYHLDQDGTVVRLGEYSSATGDTVCGASLQLGVETVALPIALDGSVQLVHVAASEQWARFLD